MSDRKIISSISDPDTLPPHVRHSESALAIWRALECRARATLLVHGSAAYKFVRDNVDPNMVIGYMVDAGTLIQIKVDLAGADFSAKTFQLGMHYAKPKQYVESQPWSTAHAVFWTYAPGNRSPLPWSLCEGYL